MTFPSGRSSPSRSRLTVVGFDPVADANKAHGVSPAVRAVERVPLVGPWTGTLDNGGETLQLERPEDLAQLGLGYVLVDRVDYDNASALADR